MTTQYKVWLEIEEIDESRDHYQTVDTPGAELRTFATYDEARSFVESINSAFESSSADAVGRLPLSSPRPTPAAGMKLLLIHGRRDPDQEMGDWGFSAELIRGVAWMHFTYLSTISVGFESCEAAEKAKILTGWSQWDHRILEVARHDDMIQAAGCYYGDFELTFDEPEEST